MLGDIIELYNFIKRMNEDYKNDKKREFNTYIDDVYQKVNIVLKDYMDIFSTIRTKVSEENWNANDVLIYIEKVEYKHKDMRIYLRSLEGSQIPLNFISSISLLGKSPKNCYTLARIGSRSCLTSKVHSAYIFRNSRRGKMPKYCPEYMTTDLGLVSL